MEECELEPGADGVASFGAELSTDSIASPGAPTAHDRRHEQEQDQDEINAHAEDDEEIDLTRALDRLDLASAHVAASSGASGIQDADAASATQTPAKTRKEKLRALLSPAASAASLANPIASQMSPIQQILLRAPLRSPSGNPTPKTKHSASLSRQASVPLTHSSSSHGVTSSHVSSSSSSSAASSLPPSRTLSAPVAPASPPSASSPPPPPPPTVSKKNPVLAEYNSLVREAKSHEERTAWSAALFCYERAFALRDASETLAKKIRILRKRCAKAEEEAARALSRSGVDDGEEASLPPPRELALVHHGKFAFDAGKQVYIAINEDANEEERSHYGDDSAPKTISATSSRLSEYALPASLFEAVYPYQRDAIAWMWSLHRKRTGGILGDDMGLGKTVQIASYLSGLFSSRQVKRVLLVAPLSVLGHWERELENWASASASSKSRSSGSSLKLLVLTSSGSKSKRDAAEAELRAMLTSSSSRGGIVLTTYGLLTSRGELFGARAFTNPSIQTWDYGVLDEGHIAKNPDTILARMLRSVPIAHRLLLSGTPVMNHLEEMWSLFDWTSGGTLLGERSAFRNEFSRPIAAGIAKGASKYERETGAALTAELRRRIEPFFLRRDKSMLAQHQTQGASNATASSHSPSSSSFIAAAVAGASSSPSIPVQKNDLIVWTYLSPLQVSLYTSFLSSSRVKAIFTNQTRSPLVALSVLKKVCDHPRLLSEEMKLCEGIGEEIGRLPSLPTGSSPEDLARAVQQLTSESSKMRLLESLLASHVEEGHRTLVFCQSRKVLGMISLLLAHHQWRHLRIDGGVADHRERQRRMDLFNADTRYKVFILTTRAGAVGLNLVGADRVVIFDPDWTPSLDNQAVDRAYRLGQTRNVVVYRFITCGTVEEVIYRKQVFKGSVIRATTSASASDLAKSHVHVEGDEDASNDGGAPDVTRYFSAAELREVFQFTDARSSATCAQLAAQHPPEQRRSYPELDSHLKQVCTQPDVHGLTDHDLLFRETAPQSTETHEYAMNEDGEFARDQDEGGPRRLAPEERAARAAERLDMLEGGDNGDRSRTPPQRRTNKSRSLDEASRPPDRSSRTYMFDLTQDSPEPADRSDANNDEPTAAPPGGASLPPVIIDLVDSNSDEDEKQDSSHDEPESKEDEDSTAEDAPDHADETSEEEEEEKDEAESSPPRINTPSSPFIASPVGGASSPKFGDDLCDDDSDDDDDHDHSEDEDDTLDAASDDDPTESFRDYSVVLKPSDLRDNDDDDDAAQEDDDEEEKRGYDDDEEVDGDKTLPQTADDEHLLSEATLAYPQPDEDEELGGRESLSLPAVEDPDCTLPYNRVPSPSVEPFAAPEVVVLDLSDSDEEENDNEVAAVDDAVKSHAESIPEDADSADANQDPAPLEASFGGDEDAFEDAQEWTPASDTPSSPAPSSLQPTLLSPAASTASCSSSPSASAVASAVASPCSPAAADSSSKWSFTITRPADRLTCDERDAYNSLLAEARALDAKAGLETDEQARSDARLNQLELYLRACDLSDHDTALQARVMELAQQFGMMT